MIVNNLFYCFLKCSLLQQSSTFVIWNRFEMTLSGNHTQGDHRKELNSYLKRKKKRFRIVKSVVEESVSHIIIKLNILIIHMSKKKRNAQSIHLNAAYVYNLPWNSNRRPIFDLKQIFFFF